MQQGNLVLQAPVGVQSGGGVFEGRMTAEAEGTQSVVEVDDDGAGTFGQRGTVINRKAARTPGPTAAMDIDDHGQLGAAVHRRRPYIGVQRVFLTHRIATGGLYEVRPEPGGVQCASPRIHRSGRPEAILSYRRLRIGDAAEHVNLACGRPADRPAGYRHPRVRGAGR
ncbi:Uncharacterised protein [Mycobacteroides abscessus subsp. abscessus]|nr:Uncharacterised protein [Mycobacteroides abscessus subsp. abscessus]